MTLKIQGRGGKGFFKATNYILLTLLPEAALLFRLGRGLGWRNP